MNKIRSVTKNDAVSICSIYNYYIEYSAISFEEETVSVNGMQQRITEYSSKHPWLVYEIDGEVVAYAYVTLWKSRSAYRFTLESTIYAAHDLKEKGVGTQLYQALFNRLGNNEIHSLMAVIALPNQVSVGLHEKMGFKKVAHFHEVGFKKSQWVDVGYWQKLL
ncbi:MAG: N-acetyltransferase family protein [Cocleimonas sp.]